MSGSGDLRGSADERRGSLATIVGFLAACVAIGVGVYGGLALTGSKPDGPIRTAGAAGHVRPQHAGSSVPLAGKIRAPRGRGVLWGVFEQGAPFSTSRLAAVEKAVHRRPAIVMWYEAWDGRPSFPADAARRLTSRGIVPMVTWEPWRSPSVLGQLVVRQPQYRLRRIADGAFDSYIRDYAAQVRRFGGPVMLRPFHEMDGFWYPWGGTVNGNTGAAFVAAWRHIHRIFDEMGASNVTWVWSVNHESVPATPANTPPRYWPGGRYVDWIGISGFNWGTSSSFGAWITFDQIYRKRIGELLRFKKPIVLSEIGAAEVGGSKPAWIRATFATIVGRYPSVRALVWYDKRDSSLQDWRIDSSAASATAFRSSVERPALLSAPAADPSASRVRSTHSR